MILVWQNRIAARGGEIQSRLLTNRYRQNGRVRRSADEEECGQMLRGVGCRWLEMSAYAMVAEDHNAT